MVAVWTGAAAMPEPPLGDVAVVAGVGVVVVVVDGRAMTWTPSVVPVVVGPTDGEVGWVTVPAPCPGAAVVVVVGGSAADLALR
jgi:hypothetical protein